MYGIPVSLPALYPAKNSMRANLVANVGMRQGWRVDFVKAAFRSRINSSDYEDAI